VIASPQAAFKPQSTMLALKRSVLTMVPHPTMARTMTTPHAKAAQYGLMGKSGLKVRERDQ
jgi:hypothetical protein